MTLESLLISHDAALLAVLRPTLEKMAVTLDVCSSTETGSDLLARHKFDAVIVDCDDLDGGLDVLKRLRKARSNGSSVTFAVLNGKTTTQEAFQIGANFVLQKPLTPLNATRCLNAALSFMVRERRRYFRHPLEMQVRIALGGAEITATATNLSEGGMAIRFAGNLPKDADAKLRFTLPATNTTLELRGQIVWADGTGHAGIKFVEVPQSSQYQLESWLTERMKSEIPARLQAYLQ